MTLPVIETLVEKISRFPSVEAVILFGSRATGQERPFSDIDLAVVGIADDHEWTHVRQLADEARTLLKIDILRFEKVEEAIRDSIIREGKVLYERGPHEPGNPEIC